MADEQNADCVPFPVQGEGSAGRSEIPLWLAEIVFDGYANRYGTMQSLEEIGRRGGFGREEVVEYIRYPHRPKPDDGGG